MLRHEQQRTHGAHAEGSVWRRATAGQGGQKCARHVMSDSDPDPDTQHQIPPAELPEIDPVGGGRACNSTSYSACRCRSRVCEAGYVT